MDNIRFRNVLASLVSASSLAIGAVGCEPTSSPAEWSVSSEVLANGASRVVNTPPAGDEEPTWWIEQDLRVGSIDDPGPTSFGEVLGIAVLEDGRFAVLETQSQELRIFDRDGSHLATYGGKGEGPGELAGAFGLMRAPDGNLWVPDHRNARMSVFHPSEGFVRTLPLRLLRRGYVWSGVMGAEGRVLKRSILMDEARSPVLRVYDSEMTLLDSLPLPREPEIDQEDPPTSFVWKTSGGFGYRRVPFFANMVVALDPAGAIWSTAFADPSYRIYRWTPGGDTTMVIETPRSPVSVTAAERDSIIEVVSAELRGRGGSVQQDWSKIPEVKPSVMAMFLSEEGQLWVRRPSTDGLIHYDVYDRDGRRAGGAATDLPLWPYLAPVVRGDEFWAVVTDEFEVPYVVRSRLIPFECRLDTPTVGEARAVCLATNEGGA
ncbi:MAG: hypothetical protein ACC682_12050 [Gemmatimonadota bacterium]